MPNRIDEIKQKRFQYLYELYEITNADSLIGVNFMEVGNKLGFSTEDSNRISDYLENEGLLKFYGSQASITHMGIVHVENALAAPEKETQYFPPVNFIHIESMSNSQIQQGTEHSTQVFNYSSEEQNAIVELIQSIKQQLDKLELPQEKKDEADADIETIEAQINSPKPKPNIIKESLTSLKTILEGVAGNVIADILLKKMTGLI
jgi:hypothetical protein